jgi:hypothetical protein
MVQNQKVKYRFFQNEIFKINGRAYAKLIGWQIKVLTVCPKGYKIEWTVGMNTSSELKMSQHQNVWLPVKLQEND